MAREWIERGLQQARVREQQYSAAAERRLHEATLIKKKGPAVMNELAAEIQAVVDEYVRLTQSESHQLEYEALPGGGFCVTRVSPPRAGLECRPDYEMHVVYCNMTRTDDPQSDPRELVFNLGFSVDDADQVALCHESRTFRSVAEVAELLLEPVLFPTVNRDPFDPDRT
jgi:hypothetical protein